MPEEVVVLSIMGMSMITALGFGFMRMISRHLERKHEGGSIEGVRQEIAELRERLDTVEEVHGAFSELEDRVDFAERLLAERRAQLDRGS